VPQDLILAASSFLRFFTTTSLLQPDFASLEILCLLPSIHLRLVGKHHVPLSLSQLILTLPSGFFAGFHVTQYFPFLIQSSFLKQIFASPPRPCFFSAPSPFLLHLAPLDSPTSSPLPSLPHPTFKLRFACQILISFQHNPRCFTVARPWASFFEEFFPIALCPASTSLSGFRNESRRQLLVSVLGRGLWLVSALTALGRQQIFCPSFLLPIYSPILALLPLPKLPLTPRKIFCFSNNHFCTLQPFSPLQATSSPRQTLTLFFLEQKKRSPA